ncbi:MAG TPA: transcription antitermination factor NusB [candidate division Zixibacteria bacterium]|nr:transcription antitermination factor NusB [candidate division Zixibacteria bacterium]
MKKTPRSLARELVLKALYACQMGGDTPDEVFHSVLVDDDEPPSEESLKYARGLFKLVLEHKDWADEHIRRLADNWVLERIATIDRFILQMAMVELEFLPDVPVKVVINEAIELAKTFSLPQSSAFVNGILDSFAKQKETPRN